MCRNWFQRFRSGDYDIHDKERSGQPKKFNDEQFEALLKESLTQTLKKLAEQLEVDKSTISRRLHIMGKIQKERK